MIFVNIPVSTSIGRLRRGNDLAKAMKTLKN